jgi:hypothetical protein
MRGISWLVANRLAAHKGLLRRVSKKGETFFHMETFTKEHGMGPMIELLIR